MRKCAWIIEWDTSHPMRERMPKMHPIILPCRWSTSRVKNVMEVIYWNSELWTPKQTFEQIHECTIPSVHMWEDGRIYYGDFTFFLVAAKARDLRISKSGLKYMMEWTRNHGWKRNEETGLPEPSGKSNKRQYIFDLE